MQRAVRQSLIAFIEDDVRLYEQSRRIWLSPSERAKRITERKAWIAALRELPDDDDVQGMPPRDFVPLDVVQALHLQPGDIVIFTTPHGVPQATAERITAYAEEHLLPLDVKACVLGDGLTVAGVLRGGLAQGGAGDLGGDGGSV